MWLKDKLVRNIIISVAVIALLAGAYIWVVNIPEDESSEPAPEQVSDVSVYKMDATEVEKVYVKNSSAEYAIMKSDSGYTVEGYENLEFSASLIANSISSLANLTAEKEIENPNMSQYGFEAPAAVMTISGGGKENTVCIGNKMVGGNGYFALHKETGKVYIMPSGRVMLFMLGVNDYRPNLLASADLTNIKTMNVTKDGQPLVNIRKLNDDEREKFSMFTSFVMTYPKYASIQSGALDEIVASMEHITVTNYVEDNPKDLSKYGLGTPAYVLELETANGSYTVAYGNKTETGGVYAMLSDKNFVFESDSAIYDSLESIQILRLLERYAHIIDMYSVSEITVSGGGITNRFVLTGDDQNKKVAVNGASADLEKFKLAYQAIIGVDVSGFTENVNGGNEEAKIEFKMYDGSTVTARYLSYDERNYALERNGVIQSTVLKENVNAMLAKINEFAANPN